MMRIDVEGSRAREAPRGRGAAAIVAWGLAAWSLVGGALGCSGAPRDAAGASPSLTFRSGSTVTERSIADLREKVPSIQLDLEDPNYHARKRYEGWPLAAVLEAGFGKSKAELVDKRFVFEAQDGYAVHADGSVVFEDGATLVFRDRDVPGWQPIGAHRVSPGPAYLVWRGDGEQRNQSTHPWPYGVVTIEVVDLRGSYGKTFPDHVADPRAKAGHELFLRECIRCHAVNREGGVLGPELNVPRNVTEYRDEATLRAFIRDPKSFRYGAMPTMAHLTEDDLDALLAYLGAMKDAKHDPGR